MKKSLTKIMLLLLIVSMTVLCLVACADKTYKVTVMDGETEIATFTVKPGEKLSKDDVLAKMEKAGYTFVGLCTDPELTKAFVFDDEVLDEITLYAKYTKKTLYISVIQGEGESKVEKIPVVDGEAYTVPTPIKEGYDFAYYTYVDDDDVEQRFPQTGTFSGEDNVRLTAHWTKQLLTVTFKAADQEETVLATQTGIEYGAKAAAITVTGYTINGYYLAKEFTNENKINLATYEVKAATTVYVDKTANNYTLTLVGYGEIPVTYDAVYTLPNPTKADETDSAYLAWLNEKIGTDDTHEWTALLGYKRGNDAFPYTGTYKIDGNAVITPNATANAAYNKATVTFFDGVSHSQMGNAVTLTKGSTVAAGDFPATAKAGYQFGGWFTSATFEQEASFTSATVVNSNQEVYAKYTGNPHTITVKDTNANGAVLATVNVTYGSAFAITEPAKFGYAFLHYLNGTEVFDPATHTTYDIDEDIVLFAIFEKKETATANFVADEENNYFKERASEDDPYTYVFLTGATYTFENYTLASTANGTYINITGNDAFVATNPGEFTLNFTAVAGGAQVNIPAKVVYDLTSVDYGNDFDAMLTNASAEGDLFQQTVEEADYVMDAGVENFKPDISIQNNANKDITMEEANIVLDMSASGAAFNGGYALSGSTLTFDNTANVYSDVAEGITLTFRPKYVIGDSYNKTLKVRFNTGVNVYTNDELRTAYGRANVQCVNVLRNIKAELPESDYVSDYGKKGNITLKNGSDTVTLENWDLGVPYNQYGRGVYRRTTNNKNDNMVVNGNYFSIDGTKLPFVTDYSSRTSGLSYQLMEVQIGIFMYRCVDIDYTGDKRDITRRYADGNVTINNLKIEGNAKQNLSLAEEAIAGEDTTLLKMSAAFIGVVVRGGTMHLNNTTILNTTMGAMLDGGVSGYGSRSETKPGAAEDWVYDKNETQSVKLYVNNGRFSGCWANNIYGYDLVALDLKNTKLGHCNGASIHFDDHAYADPDNATYQNTEGYSRLNSQLTMDQYTAINLQNWVTGSEAWFKAYGQDGNALMIKVAVENIANGKGMTILQNASGGAAGSMMNFAILVNAAGSGTWASDTDGHVKITTPSVYAPDGMPAVEFLGEGDTPSLAGQMHLSLFVGDYEAMLHEYINMHLYLPLYPMG